MHLLYLDDSGSVLNSNEEYIVLVGLSIYETQGFYLSNELDKIVQSIDPRNYGDIEFYASEIFSRRTRPWDKLSRDEAQGIIKAVNYIFLAILSSLLVLFILIKAIRNWD